MACILHIETATAVCSVVVSKDGTIIFEREELKGPSHASVLGVFVDEAIRELRKQSVSLDAISVSCGPGSYTGLRIGVSEAKGLCYGLGIPLIAIRTLEIMASSVIEKNLAEEASLFCPMIDARRMEVYDCIYDKKLKEIKTTSADIIEENSFEDLLQEHKIAFFGDGAAKCKEILTHPNALFLENIYPHASDMISLAQKAFSTKNFVDVAYFEPFYLKDFITTTPKNKILS